MHGANCPKVGRTIFCELRDTTRGTENYTFQDSIYKCLTLGDKSDVSEGGKCCLSPGDYSDIIVTQMTASNFISLDLDLYLGGFASCVLGRSRFQSRILEGSLHKSM